MYIKLLCDQALICLLAYNDKRHIKTCFYIHSLDIRQIESGMLVLLSVDGGQKSTIIIECTGYGWLYELTEDQKNSPSKLLRLGLM
ncbi:hypothetical protein VCO01S_12890 [Vibrio comitans NBRC 102076]|uniref:Uncharacterized protein n=1 Tax=Vibrio comitans NBRC 102076 TaxID=1219078 RepID=A0A4Y3IL32_9VIBR|nr:hypothetical protein VCO01S_12890 [Vibrio comitans NBRC 102076]